VPSQDRALAGRPLSRVPPAGAGGTRRLLQALRRESGPPAAPAISDAPAAPAAAPAPHAPGAGADDAVHRLLGELETEVMGVVWRRGQATVREVLEELTPRHHIAYTTAMTVMARLAGKGLLRRRRRGKAHHYEAAQTRDEFLRSASQRLVRTIIDDFGDVAVAAMVQELERVDPARLERLRLRLGLLEVPAPVRASATREGPDRPMRNRRARNA
jgi:predicted transcriptional regulator